MSRCSLISESLPRARGEVDQTDGDADGHAGH